MKRKILVVLLAAGFALVLVLLAAKSWADYHYYDGYVATLPLNAEVEAATTDKGFKRIAFYFDGMPGERVPGLLALPESGSGPYPCIIFLHGIGQSKGFVDDIAGPYTKAGFALVSFDQYMRGERRTNSKNIFLETNAMRRRGALTVNDTRRLVDYLVTRPDIAPDRIYMVGASFGAITGATAAAFEPRIRAVVLTYGGARIPLLLKSEAAVTELGMFAMPVAYLGGFLFSPADPEQYVGRISPRPVLFQNGKADSLIPAAAAKALQQAAKEPKEVIWYEGDHVGVDEAATWRIIDDGIAWIKKQDQSRPNP